MTAARVIVEVQAGLIPERPEPEFSRRWALSDEEWDAASLTDHGQSVVLAELNGRAQGYAAWLMLQPDRINWVRTDWIWL